MDCSALATPKPKTAKPQNMNVVYFVPAKLMLRIRLRIIMPKTRRARLAMKAGRGIKNKSQSEDMHNSTEPDIVTPSQEESRVSYTASLGSTLVQEFRCSCTEAVRENQETYAKYAQEIKKYMRNQFDFFGIKAPQRRTLQKEVIDKNKEILKDREVLFSFLRELWLQDEREFQAFGTDFCQQFRKEMLGITDDHFREAVAQVEMSIMSKSWWDTVDNLAYQGVILSVYYSIGTDHTTDIRLQLTIMLLLICDKMLLPACSDWVLREGEACPRGTADGPVD